MYACGQHPPRGLASLLHGKWYRVLAPTLAEISVRFESRACATRTQAAEGTTQPHPSALLSERYLRDIAQPYRKQQVLARYIHGANYPEDNLACICWLVLARHFHWANYPEDNPACTSQRRLLPILPGGGG